MVELVDTTDSKGKVHKGLPIKIKVLDSSPQCIAVYSFGEMVELVYTRHSKCRAERHAGSSPALATSLQRTGP